MRNFGNIALLLLLLANCFHAAHAQKHDYVWVFGDSAGVDFNGPNGPRAFMSGRTDDNSSGENCPTLSDADGNLLVFPNHNDLFPVFPPLPFVSTMLSPRGDTLFNGDSLYGHPFFLGVFLPVPGERNSYYYLNLDRRPGDMEESRLYYAEGLFLHKLSFDSSGSGSVVEKNMLLQHNEYSLGLGAIKHANGQDWWLLAHELRTNRYVKYLITSQGISGPEYQAIGIEPWGSGRAREGLFFGGGASFSRLTDSVWRSVLNI